MSRTCFDKHPCLLLMFFVFLSAKVYSQPGIPEHLQQRLASKLDKENNAYLQIADIFNKNDSLFVLSALETMEKNVPLNHHYDARFFCLKGEQLSGLINYKDTTLVKQYFEKSINAAYRSADDYLISFICQVYGRVMYDYQELETSITYYLKAAEIEERLNQKVNSPYFVWFRLGIALFHIREFEKSIYYIEKGLERWSDTSELADRYRISYWNAVGQDYQQLGKFDSALISFEKSIEIAKKRKNEDWAAIDYGFMGQVYCQTKQYEKAKPLLGYSYDVTKKFDYNIAASSLQWLSRIHLAEGKKENALLLLREAFGLFARSTTFMLQNREYLQYAYLTMADTYRSFGNTDSFYHYFQLYSSLHDSLERVVAMSGIKIAQMRIASEKNYRMIQALETEKKDQVLIRNLFITAVVLLSIIALLYTNRQKLKYRYREQIAVKAKQAAQMEIASAKEHLRLITESVIEKTNLVEKLQQQVQLQRLNSDQYKMIEELTNVTILTEEEWSKFKTLFEKVYPGFFLRLKEKASDITVAEQRMAALTRLHLTPRQMAAMLGISIDSVHKARQRLRHRLNIGAELNLEQSINSF